MHFISSYYLVKLITLKVLCQVEWLPSQFTVVWRSPKFQQSAEWVPRGEPPSEKPACESGLHHQRRNKK